jgi:hypothetical protein
LLIDNGQPFGLGRCQSRGDIIRGKTEMMQALTTLFDKTRHRSAVGNGLEQFDLTFPDGQ